MHQSETTQVVHIFPQGTQWPMINRILSQKLSHFHKNIRSCVENECCCPRKCFLKAASSQLKIVYCQYHDCWWSGTARSQGISCHVVVRVDLVLPESFSLAAVDAILMDVAIPRIWVRYYHFHTWHRSSFSNDIWTWPACCDFRNKYLVITTDNSKTSYM